MSLGTQVNLHDAAAVCDLFERAAEATLNTPNRRGSVVELGSQGVLVITGDLHDNLENYDRILRLAHLNGTPDRHLVLQEIIHGDHFINGHDFSYRTLARVAQLKCTKPAQVHHLLSNHELSQAMGEGLMKDGVSVVEAFDAGLDYIFGDAREKVSHAIHHYIRTLPLAVRCSNGLFCAHSLPPMHMREIFDATVLDRRLTDEDLAGPCGSAYIMVWGRGLEQSMADELAAKWGVKQFVLGHQHAEMGWERYGETMLVINSDHSHGVVVEVELSKSYTRDELCEAAVSLNGVI